MIARGDRIYRENRIALIIAAMRDLLLATSAFSAVLLFGATAQADLIDPAEHVCAKAGEACEVDGKKGVCKAETCSKLDYSNLGPGGSPGTRSYDCVRCQVGAAPAEDTKDAKAPDAKAPDAKALDAKDATPANVKASSKSDDKAAEKSSSTPEAKSGCSVSASTTSMASFAVGLLVLGFVARRRRG